MAAHDLSQPGPSPSGPAAPPFGKTVHARVRFQARVLGGLTASHCPGPCPVSDQLSALRRPNLGVGFGHCQVPCSGPGACLGSGLGEEGERCACLVSSSDADGTFLRGPQQSPREQRLGLSSQSTARPRAPGHPCPPSSSPAQATLEWGSPLAAWGPDPKCWDHIPGQGAVRGTWDAGAWRGAGSPRLQATVDHPLSACDSASLVRQPPPCLRPRQLLPRLRLSDPPQPRSQDSGILTC